MTKSTYLPTYIQFETNMICGAHCKMCPHDKIEPRREMKWSELSRLIDKVAPYAEYLCPFLLQEPTHEKRLAQILSYIKQVNPMCKTVIYSNMSKWTQELTDKIVDRNSLDELYISFYAPTREHYKTWQPGLDYDQTVDNIMYWLEQNDGQTITAFNYIAIDDLIGENSETVKLFMDRWKKYAPVRFLHYDTFHGVMPKYGDNDKHFGEGETVRAPCNRLWSGLNILSNGNVVPCCSDYAGDIILGNIHETPLEEIWRGDKFNKLRQQHLDGKQDEIPMCRDCTIWRHDHKTEWNKLWNQ